MIWQLQARAGSLCVSSGRVRVQMCDHIEHNHSCRHCADHSKSWGCWSSEDVKQASN